MRVLWICNQKVKIVSELLGNTAQVFGGWLDMPAEMLSKNPDIDFSILYRDLTSPETDGKTAGFSCHSFGDKNCRQRMESVISAEKPDIIHIHGAEFFHSLIAAEVCEKLGVLDRCVVSIQGIISEYAKHYADGVPEHIVNSYTFRDFIRHDNIALAREAYAARGRAETEVLKKAKNIIGRTDWDRETCLRINPGLNYCFCNETLRPSFYRSSRNECSVIPHSVFFSQYTSPVKGFHFLLEAMPGILERFPDTKIYVTGGDLLKMSVQQRLRLTSYNRYLISLINKNSLNNNVVFLGNLPEENMCKQYLLSEVFVSASTLENSSNSICEAMITGCPVAASSTGGTPSMLESPEEGLLYRYDDPNALADSVCRVFEDKEKSSAMAEKAMGRAKKRHDPQKNMQRLLQIYGEICNS